MTQINNFSRKRNRTPRPPPPKKKGRGTNKIQSKIQKNKSCSNLFEMARKLVKISFFLLKVAGGILVRNNKIKGMLIPALKCLSSWLNQHISVKCHDLKHVQMNFDLKQPTNICKSHP